jgi:DnaK suppressor protein
MNNPTAVLLAKQKELLADLAQKRSEVRDAGDGDVGDGTDAVTNDQGSAEAVQVASMESRTLEQVEDALKRVADGTYGKCVECGKQIAPARLAAIPWTPYCAEDQEKRDNA